MSSTSITYPGLSAELVINQDYTCNSFFELVSSCGVFCRMPEAMQLGYINSLIKHNVACRGIIFVTDSGNKPQITTMLQKTEFPSFVVEFHNVAQQNNHGLRVNLPSFTDANKFTSLLEEYPDYIVITSTPFSCPDLSKYITNKDTIANRSSLFFFENKRVYSNKFREETGFLGEVATIEQLRTLIDAFSEDSLFFLKRLGEYTGGSTVLPLNKDILLENYSLIKRFVIEDTYYLYKDLGGLNITSSLGTHHGTQFRAFLNSDNICQGFIIKFSANPVKGRHARTSLKRTNQLFNSSSGTAISILFEVTGESILAVSLSLSKTDVITDLPKITEYLQDLSLGNLSISSEEDLAYIKKLITPKTFDLHIFFNNFFFGQDWDSLYGKFLTEKTYFDSVV